MCLSIPGKLTEITETLDETFRLGRVSFDGVVKEVNPEAYICGEIWWEAQRWLQGDQLTACRSGIIQPVLK